MPGVRTYLEVRDGKPLICIVTDNLGLEPIGSTRLERRLRTSDVGKFDDKGRLRVLGRSDDFAIAGLWPRDTLDLIGWLLGTHCALIRHPDPGRVIIRLLPDVAALDLDAITRTVAKALDIALKDVEITFASNALLHSGKIARKSAVSESTGC
jgi:hypothetical protein